MAEIGIKFDKKRMAFLITVIDFKQADCLKTLDTLYVPATKNDKETYYAFLTKHEQTQLAQKLVGNL